MNEPEVGGVLSLRDLGEFQAWFQFVCIRSAHVPVAEAMMEADTMMRGVRARVPAVLMATPGVVTPRGH
jgi:hypothetical protein